VVSQRAYVASPRQWARPDHATPRGKALQRKHRFHRGLPRASRGRVAAHRIVQQGPARKIIDDPPAPLEIRLKTPDPELDVWQWQTRPFKPATGAAFDYGTQGLRATRKSIPVRLWTVVTMQELFNSFSERPRIFLPALPRAVECGAWASGRMVAGRVWVSRRVGELASKPPVC
jgi:hypothetical protein